MKQDDAQTNKINIQAYDLKIKEQQQLKIKTLEMKLSNAVQFDKKDPNQTFYRNIDDYPLKQLTIKRLGWKIADLSREQQDLALLCFTHLHNQTALPITIFTNSLENQKGQPLKTLWLETLILSSPESADYYEKGRNNIEFNLFSVFQNQLLPFFRSFLHEQITWKNMASPNFNPQLVVEAFQQRVLSKVRQVMDNYVEDYGNS